MFRIGKRKDKDEDLEEEKKELNPKAIKKPRKKKEPKKLWGKKERIIVISVISFTIFSSFLLFILSKDWHLPKISLSSSNISKDKPPVVLENSESKDSDLTKDEILKALNERLSNISATYGVEIIELSTGKNYGINQNEKFEGASFFKVPLMIALYIEKEKGLIDFSSSHTLKESEKVGGAGVIVGLPEGTVLSYKDLISYMAKDSDNTAFNILGNQIGWNHVDEVINKAGMLNTSFKDSLTTPYDMGLLFQKLMNGDLVSDSSKKEIFDLFTNTDNDNLIPQGVGKDIRVVHKYAAEVGVINDAGIIFTKDPYVLVIMTKGEEEAEANAVIPDLSCIVFDVLNK